MDLYDFIESDFVKPSQKKKVSEVSTRIRWSAFEMPEALKARNSREAEEASAALLHERESFTSERKALEDRIAALVSHFEELKNKRDELVLQLQASESERLAALESNAALLRKERNDFEERMRSQSSEKDSSLIEAQELLKEQVSETERLRADISALRQELAGLKRMEVEKDACFNELGIVQYEFTAYVRKTKIAFVIAGIVAIAVIAGIFICYSKRTAGEQSQVGQKASIDNRSGALDPVRKLQVAGQSSAPQHEKTSDKLSARWPGIPFALKVGGFRVSVNQLKPDVVRSLPASLRKEEAETHNFYSVRIRSGKGKLSEEFLKSPVIDFVDSSSVRMRQAGPDSGLRVVSASTSGSRKPNSRHERLRCVVSVKKDFRPSGIIIEHPNKDTLSIVIS